IDAAVTTELEARDRALAAAGLHRHAEGAVEGAVGTEGSGALADLVAQAPEEREDERRRRRLDREAVRPDHRLAVGVRDSDVTRPDRRRARDRERDRELGGRHYRRRADRDARAEGR